MDPHTRSANVRVAADAGSVLVTGSAGSERVANAIVDTTGRVPGVVEVHSEVGVGGHWQW